MITLTSTFGMNNILQLIGVVIVFLFVLALTYFTTKWLAGYQLKSMKNKNLKVVETLKLTNNKYIQIVEVGEVYLVISIGKDEVHLLTQLNKDQLTLESLQLEKSNLEFSEVLNKFKEYLPKK